MSEKFNKSFIEDETVPFIEVFEGINRKVMTYSVDMMITKMTFEEGTTGPVHNHPHTQIGYVVKGKFEVTIGESSQILKEGDVFFVPPLVFHGLVCLEKGILVDVFNPYRADYV